jgi:hypothetical protein
MADKFEPDSQRAMKKFPGMRMTRAMAMDRVTHMFKTDRAAAIKYLNGLMSKGADSGGFNGAEKKIADKWYDSKKSGLSKNVNERVANARASSKTVSGGAGMMVQPDVTSKSGRKSLLKKE